MDSILTPLREVFFWFLRSSLEAGVVILLVLAIQGVLRRRLSPRWHYWLWLILLVRMVLPWTPESPFSLFGILPSFEPAALAGAPPVNTTQGGVPNEMGVVPQLAVDTDVYSPPAAGQRAAVDSTRWISLVDAAILLWLAMALGFTAHVLIASALFLRRTRASSALTDPAILHLFAECKDAMGVHIPVELSVTGAIGGPVLAGFIRPRLLLPRNVSLQLTPHQLRFILLHELAHVKRRDVLISWMTTVLQAAHWFNPLVWYAFYRMRLDREMACDALVLSRLREEETRRYGQTMLDLLVSVKRTRMLPGMAAILEDRSQMERRITMIAFFKKSAYRWSISAAALLIAVSALVLTGADSGSRDEGPAKAAPIAAFA